MEELSPSKHFRYTVVELYKSLTFSLRASGEVHFTGSFIPSDFCSTSLVRPKSDTFAMLSSDISTFRAARSLRDQRQKQHSLVTVVLTRTVFSLSLSQPPLPMYKVLWLQIHHSVADVFGKVKFVLLRDDRPAPRPQVVHQGTFGHELCHQVHWVVVQWDANERYQIFMT